MITFTDTARKKVLEYMDMSETPSLGVRVVAHRFGRHQFRYELSLVMEGEESEEGEPSSGSGSDFDDEESEEGEEPSSGSGSDFDDEEDGEEGEGEAVG